MRKTAYFKPSERDIRRRQLAYHDAKVLDAVRAARDYLLEFDRDPSALAVKAARLALRAATADAEPYLRWEGDA